MRRLLVVLAVAAALTIPGIALASAPTVETDLVDVTFTPPLLSASCGFPVTRHVTGTITIRTYINAVGDFTREIDTDRLTESVSANGHVLYATTTQVIVVTARADGAFSVAFMGTDFRLRVPGSGIAFGSAGRFVLLVASDGDVSVVQDVGDVAADVAAICAALA